MNEFNKRNKNDERCQFRVKIRYVDFGRLKMHVFVFVVVVVVVRGGSEQQRLFQRIGCWNIIFSCFIFLFFFLLFFLLFFLFFFLIVLFFFRFSFSVCGGVSVAVGVTCTFPMRHGRLAHLFCQWYQWLLQFLL